MAVVLLFLAFLLAPISAYAQSYADIIEEVMPSVVNISIVKEAVENDNTVDNLMIAPDLEGRESLGTGFFIRDDGYILTNYHVVKTAQKISVITNDETNYEAKVTGIDKISDLAVLKIVAPANKKFKPVIFGNADKARIGDIVLTIGNPYGLGISVSQGIISAKSREIGFGEQHYIQTDAAINEGNSGGPMFNTDGEVIGINTVIFTQAGANGVGFALPSNIANWVSDQLIKNGKVRRGWIGFNVAYGMDKYTDQSGFVITEIVESSQAYSEGLRIGDIIVSYNDKKAMDLNDFRLFTETMSPGDALRLKILSLGEEFRYVLRIQDMPSDTLKNITNKALSERNKYIRQNEDSDVFYISELGIAVKEASPRGLSITKIEKRSPLFFKGLTLGDVILEVNNSEIYNPDNLLEVIHNALVEDIKTVSLLIQGTENVFYVNVEVTPEDD